MITKTFAQDGTTCRVTFRIQAAIESATLLGDFNLWNPEAHPLERGEDGSLGVTVALAPGDYRFRYLADGREWLNDETADGWVPNLFGGADSIVAVKTAETAAPAEVLVAGAKPVDKPARPRATAKKTVAKAAKPAPKPAKLRAAKAKKPAKPTP